MRMKRTHLGTAIGATAASVALGMTLAGPAGAVSPDPAPFCAGGGFVRSSAHAPGAIPDNSAVGIRETITVTGQTGTVRDVDLITNIAHTFNGDLEMELTHMPPGGPTKTIRFVNDSRTEREAAATRFSGHAVGRPALDVVVRRRTSSDPARELNLVPEGPMAAFIGDNPNGDWTLTRHRPRCPQAPPATARRAGSLDVTDDRRRARDATTSPFLGAGGRTSTTVADGTLTRDDRRCQGLGTYLTDLDLITQIEHNLSPERARRSGSRHPRARRSSSARAAATGSLASLTTTLERLRDRTLITSGVAGPPSRQTRPAGSRGGARARSSARTRTAPGPSRSRTMRRPPTGST